MQEQENDVVPTPCSLTCPLKPSLIILERIQCFNLGCTLSKQSLLFIPQKTIQNPHHYSQTPTMCPRLNIDCRYEIHRKITMLQGPEYLLNQNSAKQSVPTFTIDSTTQQLQYIVYLNQILVSTLMLVILGKILGFSNFYGSRSIKCS